MTTPGFGAGNAKPGWLELAAVGLILAAALALRLYGIGAAPLSLDEFWNAELSTGRGTLHETVLLNQVYVPPPATSLRDAPGLWTIPASLDRVTHPPLYSMALRVWREAFGSSDGTMRAYSAIMAAAVVIPLYLSGRTLLGSRVALWASAIYAFSPTMIQVSREIRPYGQLMLLTWLTIWQIVRIESLGRSGERVSWGRLALVAVSGLAMLLTHYFSSAVLMGLAVYAWLRVDRGTLRRLLLCAAAAVVVFLVAWMPQMLVQRVLAADAAVTWLRDPHPEPVRMALLRACDLPLRLLFEPRRAAYPAPYFAILFVVASAALAWRERGLVLWLAVFASLTSFLLLLDLAQGSQMLDFPRYSAVVGPAVCVMLVGLVMSPIKGRWAHGAVGLVLVAMLPSMPRAFEGEDLEYREFAAFLDETVDPDRDIVLFARRVRWEWKAGFLYTVWSHYSRHERPARCAFIDDRPGEGVQRDLRSAGGRIWLVSSDGRFEDLLVGVPGWRAEPVRSFLLIGDIARLVPNDAPASEPAR